MQIEKNIAATLQRRMDEAGKTKLEFSRDLGIPRSTLQGVSAGRKGPPFRLHRRACKETRHISGTADLGPGAAEAVSPAANAASSLAQHSLVRALAEEIVEAALRRSGEWAGLDAAETGNAPDGAVSICALRGARRGKSAVCVWHFGPAAAGWGMENSRDDRAIFQRQRRDCASGAALHRAAA